MQFNPLPNNTPIPNYPYQEDQQLPPLAFLVCKRITIFFIEWIFYYFLMKVISRHRDRGWFPKVLILILVPYLIHEYLHLEILEQTFQIDQPTQFSLAYLVFRQTMVILDLVVSLQFLYWIHYLLQEKDLIVLIPVWIGTLLFNGIGFYYLRQLENCHGLYPIK